VKFTSYKDLMKNDSDKVLLKAIKGMLPKNRLGNEILTHLRIYKDSNHGQEAQQPTEWSSI
jgi:large subunit ribosomal protein L13